MGLWSDVRQAISEDAEVQCGFVEGCEILPWYVGRKVISFTILKPPAFQNSRLENLLSAIVDLLRCTVAKELDLDPCPYRKLHPTVKRPPDGAWAGVRLTVFMCL